jgi:hypothetical protein
MPRLPDKQHDEILDSFEKLTLVMMHQLKHMRDVLHSMKTTTTQPPDLRTPDAPTRPITEAPELPEVK